MARLALLSGFTQICRRLAYLLPSVSQCPCVEQTKGNPFSWRRWLCSVNCLSCPFLSLPPCCIGICSSNFSAPFPGVTIPLGYWIYHGLVPNSKCLFLNGTVCTSLVQPMLLFPRGLCQQTLVRRFTAQNSFAGQVVFNLCFFAVVHWQTLGSALPHAQGISVGAVPACRLSPASHPGSCRGCRESSRSWAGAFRQQIVNVTKHNAVLSWKFDLGLFWKNKTKTNAPIPFLLHWNQLKTDSSHPKGLCNPQEWMRYSFYPPLPMFGRRELFWDFTECCLLRWKYAELRTHPSRLEQSDRTCQRM